MQSDVNKRRAARRKKIRRRRLKFIFVFFLVITFITLSIMCFTTFFPIKTINVSGSKIYSKSEIVKASKLTTNNNVLAVSEKDIEKNIRKKLPYVDNVQLKRSLPDSIALKITDAKEKAFYKIGDKFYIISSNNYILSEQTEKPENVFEIVTGGLKGKISEKVVYKNSAEKDIMELLLNKLDEKKLNIDKIDVSNIYEIKLDVEERFNVNIGSSEYLNEKIAHLASMIDNIPDRSGSINLSMWTPKNSQGTFIENKK